MPSKKEIQLFEMYATNAAKCWVLGVDLDSHRRRIGFLVPTKSKYKLASHFLFIIWMVFLNLFCIYRTYIIYPPKSAEPLEKALFMVYLFPTASYLTAFTWLVSFALSRKELINLWNQFLQYNLNEVDPQREGKSREKYLWYGHKYILGSCIAGSIVVAICEYIFVARQGWLFVICFGMSIATFCTALFASILLYVILSYIVMFFIAVNDTLHRLSDLEIETAFTNYRTLCLLCRYLNGVYSKAIIPTMKYSVSIVGIICFYVGVRVKVLPGLEYGFLLIALCAFVMTISFANIISFAWYRSTTFLAVTQLSVCSIKETQERMYIRKVQKSLLPLRISVGGFYYMEKEAKLTFMQFLLNGNINLLVTFK